MTNLATCLESFAVKSPKKIALKFEGETYTYAQLNEKAGRIAAALQKLGIGKGDNVALSCPNLPAFPLAYYAILKTGATVVPLNILLTVDEIAYHLADSQAKAFFYHGESIKAGSEAFKKVASCQHEFNLSGSSTFPEILSQGGKVVVSVAVGDTDTAVILYTSGTTGKPKGAELTHSNLLKNAESCRELFKSESNETNLVVLPLFHSFGQTAQMNCGFLTGQTLIFLPRFTPVAAVKTIRDEKVTIFCGVPTMYWAMLTYLKGAEGLDGSVFSSLRIGVSGGSPMPVEIMTTYEKDFGLPILEGYGLSETSPVATFNRLDKPRKPGTVGMAINGVEVKVIGPAGESLKTGESGEVLIRGHNVMKGYYNQPEATEKSLHGGWLHTGDVGVLDQDGYLSIVDRIKDMIIRGGYNVYPREIEECLMQHPAVSLVAVVGVPHERQGEEIKAHIVLKPGVAATESEIIAWSQKLLAKYKYPRIVQFETSLPMTATGKVLKRELRKS